GDGEAGAGAEAVRHGGVPTRLLAEAAVARLGAPVRLARGGRGDAVRVLRLELRAEGAAERGDLGVEVGELGGREPAGRVALGGVEGGREAGGVVGEGGGGSGEVAHGGTAVARAR